jgi:hypothetical protein
MTTKPTYESAFIQILAGISQNPSVNIDFSQKYARYAVQYTVHVMAELLEKGIVLDYTPME